MAVEESTKLSIVSVPIKELKLNKSNRNRHSSEQISRLAKIIEYFGFRQPIIVSNQSGIVIAGEGRIKAAKKLGLKEVPVMFQDFQDVDAETAFGIADNAIQGDWMDLDLSGINEDIQAFDGSFDLELLGIKHFTVDVADKGDIERSTLKFITCPNCQVEFEDKQSKGRKNG